MSFPRLLWEAVKSPFKHSDQFVSDTQETSVTPKDLQAINYETFEQLVDAIYEARRYETRLTKSGADRGVDVIAEDDEKMIAIQAKRYSKGNRVGVRPIREIIGAAAEFDADEAAVATSSSFTGPAIETAESLDVTLVDGERCCKLIKNSPERLRRDFSF